MIDNTAKKEPTRFVVVREFNGTQSMEDVFGSLVERQANDNYERWKSDHGGNPDQKTAVADGVVDILAPVPAQTDQTA